jgi:replicative DNA helicase
VSAGFASSGNFERGPRGAGGSGGRGRFGPAIAISAKELFDRQPPFSLEAEMSLLGSLILDPKVTPDALPLIKNELDFYDEKHSHIYKALIDLYDQRNSGDLVQLLDLLRDRHVLDLVGGPEYLEVLVSGVPAAVNAPHFARIVGEKAKLRRLIDTAGQIIYDAYHSGQLGPEGAREVLDKAEMAVFEIAQETVASDPQALAILLEQEILRIEAADFEGGAYTGVATGYHDLDEMLRGFQPGELIIIAARPSMGKTALALNLAEQMALGGLTAGMQGAKPVPIGLFSLEMSKNAIVQRLLSARSGVSSQSLRGGHKIPDSDFRNLIKAAEDLKSAPVYIDDTPDLTVLNLRARARRMVQQYGVRCIMIDYLQLMSAPGAARESRQVEVSTISRGVKALSRELKIPVICLSQLNRGSEQREGNRPRMSDLRESGSIEQDADVVILLHREEYYHVQDEDWKLENPDKVGLAELIIAKQRNGPTGIVKLGWDTKTTRFKGYESPGNAGGFDIPPLPSSRGYSSPSAAAGNFATAANLQGMGATSFDPAQSWIMGGAASSAPFEVKPTPPQTPAGGSSFANRPKTGPPDSHRDGGGSDQRPDFDEADEGL